MKILTTLMSIVILFALILIGEYGTKSIPPLGKILNPSTGFWQNAKDVGHINMPSHVKSKMRSTTFIDDKMIPIFKAKTYNEALFAQGFFHAKMRLWQMDFITRVSAGRLSEILGERALNFDKLQRRRGLAIAAKDAAKSLDKYPKTKKSLEAYIAGVNHYINELNEANYPLEFKLLNYNPERWSLEKCGLILKYMAYILAGRDKDIPLTNAMKYFGKINFDHIYPQYNKLQSPIISTDQSFDYIDSILPIINNHDSIIDEIISNPLIQQPVEGNGSNNWAVSGNKTKSGDPMLCNDPHLTLGLPSIWIQNQILTDETHVHGVSIPGVPGIVIGFNEYLAWGVTNGGHDVLDWYKLDWVDDRKNSYWLDGEKTSIGTRIEIINIKYQDPVYDTVKTSYWGPIVYESEQDDHFDLAMRWAVVDPTTTDEIGAFLNLNKAKNYAEYREAIASFKTPLQNSVYADKLGNIALTLQGRLLLKHKDQGRFVQDGSKKSNNWQGYIPVSHNPRELNPKRNFVSSANQISTDSNYPYHYVNGDFRPYRGRILNRFLEEENDFDIHKMKSLQQSSYNLKAEDVLATIIKIAKEVPLNEEAERIIDDFNNWNYEYHQDQTTPIKFELFWKSLYSYIWDEIEILKDSIKLQKPAEWRTIELINESPNDKVFDIVSTDKKEVLKDLVFLALNETVKQFESLDVENWSAYKNTHINHLLKLKGFNFDHITSGGVGSALNAIKETHGPSWRLIVSMGDTIEAYGIFPGGQNGNPGSPYYDNQINDWAKGIYHKIHFTRNLDEIIKRTVKTIEFEK